MRPELIVAEKEFRDHITSKRFIVIFGMLMLLAIYGIDAGMNNYYQQLEDYKNPSQNSNHFSYYSYVHQEIESLQRMIQDAIDRGDSPEEIAAMQRQLDLLTGQPMPSIKDVFQSMVWLLTIMGMILGAAMGFDQISREKDEGSIKFLASSPIYRDAIINGKTIGALLTLAIAMAAAFVIAIAIVLIKGAVPGIEDLMRITLFFVASMLYCSVFFAIAMVISTLSKNTATSAVFTVGVIVLLALYSVLAIGISSWVADVIVGPAPETGNTNIVSAQAVNGSSLPTSLVTDYAEYGAYQMKRQEVTRQISDVITAVSPVNDFSGTLGVGSQGVASALMSNPSSTYYLTGPGYLSTVNIYRETSLIDALGGVWTKALALLVEIIVAFGIAYVSFMRADIR